MREVFSFLRICDIPSEVLRSYTILQHKDAMGLSPVRRQGINRRFPGTSNIISKFRAGFFRICCGIMPWMALVFWVAAGVCAAAPHNLKNLMPFWISIEGLALFLLILFIRYLRFNCSLFYFFAHEPGIPCNTMAEYLAGISQTTAKHFLSRMTSFCHFFKPRDRIFIRALDRYCPLSRKIRNRILQIVHVATCLADVNDAYWCEDRYLLTRFIINQKLLDMAVVVTSLWAMSWGFCQKFGAMVTLILLMLTLGWFYWRFNQWIHALRCWATTLPYLLLQPMFKDVQMIYPKAATQLQDYSLTIIQLHDVVGSHVYHAIIGVYLIVFLQLANLNQGGQFWGNASDTLKTIYMFFTTVPPGCLLILN